MELTEFLLARITEDEAIAHEATNDGHKWLVEEETISLWPDDLEPATGNIHFPRKAHAYHAVTWNPTRVLAECDAKRRIIERHARGGGIESWMDEDWIADMDDVERAGYCEWCTYDNRSVVYPCADLRAVALPFSDHPDYDPQWRH